MPFKCKWNLITLATEQTRINILINIGTKKNKVSKTKKTGKNPHIAINT